MKKIILIILLIMANTNSLFAQNNATNNDAGIRPGITFQHVKTQSINVGGTDFNVMVTG